MKYALNLLIVLAFCTALQAQSPKYEVRAVWLTTLNGLDWPRSHGRERQQQELCATLDCLRSAGVNTVLLQTRVRATTIYPSDLEPWDGCLTGTPGRHPGYDALQFCIDECHKRGMELHAWVVTIPVGKWNALGCRELRKKYPRLIRRIGDEGYLDPEQPETSRYLARICREIVSRYDVDGIHLDYIRYPETWRLKTSRQQGRSHITRIVRAVSEAVKAGKPWVKMSCSPIGKHDDLLRYRSGGWNARTAVCQDAQQWLRDGLMDELFPMMYFRDNQFFPFAIDWQEQAAGRIVVPGLGIYFLDPREGRWQLSDVVRQLYVTRQIGVGHCYFRSKFLTDDVKGLCQFVRQFDAVPALVPPMTWYDTQPPSAPTRLTLRGQRLEWGGAADHSGAPYLLYNIYASRHNPVDTGDAACLIATRLQATSLVVPDVPGMHYAVTAIDRYGLESEARQLHPVAHATSADSYWHTDDVTRSDGHWLRLPKKDNTLDADFIMVETLAGQTLGTFAYSGDVIDVSRLPEGVFALRSLGRKGRNHRLGFFTIKRSH